jgi:hypothetical protein
MGFLAFFIMVVASRQICPPLIHQCKVTQKIRDRKTPQEFTILVLMQLVC